MEAAVVECLQEQSQEVDERQSDEQSQGVRLRLDRVSVTPPGGQQDASVSGDEGVVDDAPASGASLCHTEPAEVPDEPHSGAVQPLPSRAVHKVGLLLPGPAHEDEPLHQEVSADVPRQDRGEEGEGRHTRGD